MTAFFIITILLAVLLCTYLLYLRPRSLRWGATDEEAAESMRGDGVVYRPDFKATRAVTVEATPEEIWPWLLQIGSKRAGWYSIDLIDNGGTPSSTVILPEFQHIAEGDFIPFTPNRKNGMWVKSFETNGFILWWDKKHLASWLWKLVPVDPGRTRLITRLRTRYAWRSPWIVYYLIADVGDIVMMRKCMLGIKERAEKARISAT
jgi:hypothetical protein